MLFFREPAAPVTIAPLKKNYLKPARLDMKGFVPKKKILVRFSCRNRNHGISSHWRKNVTETVPGGTIPCVQ
jgi:hypothetical protein